MSETLTLRQAARELGLSISAVQKSLQRGAPCVRPGLPGRGRGALLDVAEFRRWRAGGVLNDDGRALRIAAETALRTFQIHGGLTGTMRRQSARLLVLYFERFHHALTGKELPSLPDEMQTLFRVSLELGQLTKRSCQNE